MYDYIGKGPKIMFLSIFKNFKLPVSTGEAIHGTTVINMVAII